MSRKEHWPFEASVDGLWVQCLILAKRYCFGAPQAEYRFHPVRKWRADAAFPELKVLCEYHGGLFMGRKGGHQTVRGARNDWEKSNEAQLLGYLFLQFGPDETRSGEAMNVIARAIESRLEGKAA